MRFATVSRAGGRDDNQDYLGRMRSNGINCFVIADGLGSKAGGRLAAKTAVDTTLKAFRVNPEISYEVIYSCMLTAQEAIVGLKEQNADLKSMSTTIAVLITNGEEAIFGNIGDSRIYMLEKNKICEITEDHSVAYSSFLMGECSYDEIRTSPDQNRLLRTMGNADDFRPQIYDKVVCTEDTAFLMCTDGLWTYVDESFIEKSYKKAKTPKAWVIKMISELEKKAPEGNDNYSAIAVVVG